MTGARGTPPPLDLKAVQRLIDTGPGTLDITTGRALLAHTHALRAALREVHEANLTASNWLNFEYRDTPVAQRVAAVLGAALAAR